MQAVFDADRAEMVSGNSILGALPEFPEGSETFRESRWHFLVLGTVLLWLGLGLGYQATMVPWPVDTGGRGVALMVAALLFAGGIHLVLHRPFTALVCAPSGLYFPRRRTGPDGRTWLCVPWHNVAGYASQRLLDETSPQALVLSLSLSAAEEADFLANYRLLGRAGDARGGLGRWRRFGIGNLAAAPDAVVISLRRYEMASLASTAGWEASAAAV